MIYFIVVICLFMILCYLGKNAYMVIKEIPSEYNKSKSNGDSFYYIALLLILGFVYSTLSLWCLMGIYFIING